uniref:Uncharacterized protein n=1 Tax=Anguilla anguilla TaxID=7936 RepID=A0A0E9SV57_ANGAN
MLVQAALPIQ